MGSNSPRLKQSIEMEKRITNYGYGDQYWKGIAGQGDAFDRSTVGRYVARIYIRPRSIANIG
jgi:hypothetical protein